MKKRTAEEKAEYYRQHIRPDVMSSAPEYGQVMRMLRLDQGWSQRDMLARLPGVISSAEISRWETGKRRPLPETLGKLIVHYKLPFDEAAILLIRCFVVDWFERMEQGYKAELERLKNEKTTADNGSDDSATCDGAEG